MATFVDNFLSDKDLLQEITEVELKIYNDKLKLINLEKNIIEMVNERAKTIESIRFLENQKAGIAMNYHQNYLQQNNVQDNIRQDPCNQFGINQDQYVDDSINQLNQTSDNEKKNIQVDKSSELSVHDTNLDEDIVTKDTEQNPRVDSTDKKELKQLDQSTLNDGSETKQEKQIDSSKKLNILFFNEVSNSDYEQETSKSNINDKKYKMICKFAKFGGICTNKSKIHRENYIHELSDDGFELIRMDKDSLKTCNCNFFTKVLYVIY